MKILTSRAEHLGQEMRPRGFEGRKLGQKNEI
jgi:hypothetical protein